MVQTTVAPHAPFRTIRGRYDGGLVVICDHASNTVPPDLGDLGLPPGERARHIAWDIGAAAIAEILAGRFHAPAVICGTSRLVIDCNRDPGDPAAIPEVSDGTVIPGNRALTVWQRTQRISRWFIPYHDAIDVEMETAIATGVEPVLLSVHSMTDAMRGVARPWPVAISWHKDERLSRPMIEALQRRITDPVGDNQPYDLDPKEDFSVPVHAMDLGLRHLQVEFRQDLVADPAGQAHWAAIFGDALAEVLGR
ncbi:MAG TPA: N-formylglutamate amidohydrolase [Dongiaceae bacterium]|nr:N-formylglutamate amidohydrolase [Dongiaceae bacterium]